MDAIANGSLFLMLGDTALSVLNLTIREKQGAHGRMSVTAAAESEVKEYLLYEEKGNAALYAFSRGSLKPVFFGTITMMQIKNMGKHCVVCLEVATTSYLMDITPRNRCFQDTDMTSHELAKRILEPYGQISRALLFIPNEKLGQIMVQYQETDWEFLNRLLSKYGTGACCDSSAAGISLRAGLGDDMEDVNWDYLPYVAGRDTALRARNGELKKQLFYQVQSHEVFSLGTKLQFRGHELYIGKIQRTLRQGLLASTYDLYFKEGMQVSRYYNSFLNVVSINGRVTGIERNRVQVGLESDALTEYKRQYFYPFSTIAASADGSGWYCMPQKGDPVRIFFPTDNESEGYAIANIYAEFSPSVDSPINNPDVKDITAPDGKSVKFVSGGIQLSVGERYGTVTLTNDGLVAIKTQEDIEITAEDAVYLTTEGTMKIFAGREIQITNDAGGSICMTEDTVEIQASIIGSN